MAAFVAMSHSAFCLAIRKRHNLGINMYYLLLHKNYFKIKSLKQQIVIVSQFVKFRDLGLA